MGKEHHNTIRIVAGYGLSLLLIPLYVNMFGVWKALNTVLGDFTMLVLPIIATPAVLGFIFLLFFKNRKMRDSAGLPAIITGAAFCLLALTVPDPQFPVKRIHVAEYLLLSLVVRYAMSWRLQGWPLVFFSALFTTLLGIHDEFLQGLHQARTYGLRDMCVNGISSWGGALICHGMGLFVQEGKEPGPAAGSPVRITALYLCWLVISVAALIFPLVRYRGLDLPLWPAMPLFAALVIFALYVDSFQQTWRHGITSVSVLSFAFVLYPPLSHTAALSFY